MNENEINKKLLDCQIKWFDQIVKHWIAVKGCKPKDTEAYFKKITKSSNGDFGFSEPFFTSMYRYEQNNPTILFVGQEMNGWSNYEDPFEEERIEESQRFVREYIDNSINKRDPNAKRRYYGKESCLYSSGKFWDLIRAVYDLKKRNINVAWTELDKMHYRCEQKKCVRLWTEDRAVLNGELKGDCGKTILQLEIETIKPDYIVFLTGPQLKYRKSMSVALGMKNVLFSRPQSVHDACVFNYGDTKCIWIYHPNARRFNFNEMAGIIARETK